MQMFCGNDIVDIARIKDAILKNPKFKEKIYTKKELEYIESFSNENIQFEKYAGRFAVKEAVYKAISELSVKEKFHLDFKDIEVINNKEYNLRPYVNILKNSNTENFFKLNLKMDISISHTKDTAIATAIVYIA